MFNYFEAFQQEQRRQSPMFIPPIICFSGDTEREREREREIDLARKRKWLVGFSVTKCWN